MLDNPTDLGYAETMTTTSYTIKSLHYQRNGVGGEGFFYVAFDFKEDGRKHSLIAVMPHRYLEESEAHQIQPEYTYIIDPENLESGWRGDRMGYVLCPWVDANKDAAWPSLYPETAKLFPVKLRG